MSTAPWVLRLLFGLACAWPLLCWPLARAPGARLRRGLLVLCLALALAALYPGGVLGDRVDAQLLSGSVCRL